MKKGLLLCLALLVMIGGAMAQKKFTYNDIANGVFGARTVRGFLSMNDGKHYTINEKGKINKYSYKKGELVTTIFDGAEHNVNFNAYTFSSDEKKMLLTTNVQPIYRHSYTAKHFVFDIETKTVTPLTQVGKEEVASFSPDGKKVAFVRDNNLFYVNLSDGSEVQVTKDGKFNFIINGKPDWVYEEEYGFAQGYQWSPDSESLSFFRFDEGHVKEYHMNMFSNQLYPSVYSFKYPKAGERNAIVTIHTYVLGNGAFATMDIGEETDQYIPRIKWTNDSKNVLVFRLNRLQNQFDLLMCDAASGANIKTVYQESDEKYINRLTDESVMFLADGDRFIIQSEKDGYNHLYLYSLTKGLLNQITKGQWEVTALYGVDGDMVYFQSAETSPIKRNLYSIKLNGGGKKRLTPKEGTYEVQFSNDFSYYISYFSNAVTPTEVTLHTANSKEVRKLETNENLKKVLAEYKIPQKEFFSFTTTDGIVLNGFMVRPSDFNANKKYPVFMTQYSGPGSQEVLDKWRVLWEECLVQEGYILVCVDGRGTGARGEAFRKCTYGNLGGLELKDQIEAAKYLGELDYIDKGRIAIYGWSYGGFMALNAMLQTPDVFKCAIAIAPVTSWLYYDTIYTELYNGLPKDNQDGYLKNSPITYAKNLKGKLLLAHGTGDDNVHIQNSMEMVARLTDAGKDFDMIFFPDQNHSMLPNWNNRHLLMIKCIDFIKRNL